MTDRPNPAPAPTAPGARMKRFYTHATAEALPEGGFGVRLDARPLRSPAKRPLALPTLGLAQLLADDWAGQGEYLLPQTMPIMTLVSTAIDRIALDPEPTRAELLGYGGNDLLSFREDHPAELAARQHAVLEPLRLWLAERGIALPLATGLSLPALDAASTANLAALLAALDPLRLTGVLVGAQATGSLGLGLAQLAGRVDAEAAFAAAEIEADWQIAQWGLDPEAERRRAGIRAELQALDRFYSQLPERWPIILR